MEISKSNLETKVKLKQIKSKKSKRKFTKSNEKMQNYNNSDL